MIDIEDEQFVVSFDYDRKAVAAIKRLARRKWDPTSRRWLVDMHRPSVEGLFALARQFEWDASERAEQAYADLLRQDPQPEFLLSVIGEGEDAQFSIRGGYDAGLVSKLRSVPGARWNPEDDCWYAPASDPNCCDALLRVVVQDGRFDLDQATKASLLQHRG